MNITRRKCHKCGFEYEYMEYGNIILFCPECSHFDYMCCDFGFGAATPCAICRGDSLLGEVIVEDNEYVLISDAFGIKQKLLTRYNEVLMEAARIIDAKMREG